MDWKKRLQKPTNRSVVFSRKQNKWLSHEESKVLMELLKEKTTAIKDEIEKDDSLSPEQKQSVMLELSGKTPKDRQEDVPHETIIDKEIRESLEEYLKEGNDEPTKEEDETKESSS